MTPTNRLRNLGLFTVMVIAVCALATRIDHHLTGGPLVRAAKRGNVVRVAERIRSHDNCAAVDYRGWTALQYAVSYGRVEVVRQLLDGCPTSELPRGAINDAFVLAGANENLKVIRLFLDRGVSVDTRNRDGATALMNASRLDLQETARGLLAAGATVNLQDHAGATALHAAVEFGSYSLVKLLLAHGADRRLRTHTGVSPWDLATRKDDRKMVSLLRPPSGLAQSNGAH